MKYKIIMTAAMGVLLAGCSQTSDPAAEKAKHLKAAEGDAVSVEFTDQAVAQSVVGFRASTIAARNKKGESLQTPCRVQGEGYIASFQGPAQVNLPSMGEATKPIKVVCDYNEKSFAKTVSPKNLSTKRRNGNALAVGIILCPICGVAMAAGNSKDKTGDAYGFDNISVTVE